ncbi:hypothetical protein Leryth_015896 [Lithospermum erythrorhizon]|nr:hypothetical protein Leryth_015896 [Lithospermum erythrorhizon]
MDLVGKPRKLSYFHRFDRAISITASRDASRTSNWCGLPKSKVVAFVDNTVFTQVGMSRFPSMFYTHPPNKFVKSQWRATRF